jgi:hypothetical protein
MCSYQQLSEDALSPALVSFAFEYVIRHIQENQEELELNGIINFLSVLMILI